VAPSVGKQNCVAHGRVPRTIEASPFVDDEVRVAPHGGRFPISIPADRSDQLILTVAVEVDLHGGHERPWIRSLTDHSTMPDGKARTQRDAELSRQQLGEQEGEGATPSPEVGRERR
jgi:hypothetical protein